MAEGASGTSILHARPDEFRLTSCLRRLESGHSIGDESGDHLGGGRVRRRSASPVWLRQNNAIVMAVLFVVFGLVLTGQGIAGV
jgi:hypothetical protein